jgi:methionine sulfoxide reductase heme-binding subunit
VTTRNLIRWVAKPLVFLAALGPLTWLIWAFFTAHLSANPLSDITNETGVWTLRFVCITLAITPVRRLTGWNVLIRFRRMTGLYAFFYGTLHFLTYVILDRFFTVLALLDPGDAIVSVGTAQKLVMAVGEDIAKRPFIMIGFTAFVLMIPLAITSTAGWIRRLGGRRWNRLHQLIYATGVCAVIHYYWLVKADVRRPLAYGAVVGGLLAFRAAVRARKAMQTSARATAAAR